MLILTDINASVTCEPGADLRLVLGMERGDREDILGEICPSTGETSFERHYNTGLLFGAGSVLFSEMIGERLVIGIWAQGYLVPVE
jgi:hypothetical protein